MTFANVSSLGSRVYFKKYLIESSIELLINNAEVITILKALKLIHGKWIMGMVDGD